MGTPDSKTPAVALAAIFLASAWAGCAGVRPSPAPASAQDTPQLNHAAGRKALDAGDIQEAARLFERSVGLDPDFQPGHLGLGLAYLAGKDFARSKKSIRKAMSLDERNPAVHVAYGRWYLAQGERGNAMAKLKLALDLAPDFADAHYWRGKVYEAGGTPRKAVKMYRRALESDRHFLAADEAWKRLQEKERAGMGLSEDYAKVASAAELTRAQVAALLVEELGIEDYLGKAPARAGPPAAEGDFAPPYDRLSMPDIERHWARFHIAVVAGHGIMEPFADQGFKPDQPITKSQFALLLQEILAKAGAEKSSATRFVGSESPFSDLPSSHFAFNAVMSASSRGLLAGKPDGSFGVADGISGSEAILSLKALEGILEKAGR